MKTIYLVRHAKSGWESAKTADFDRSLNDKGLKDAPLMAAILKEKKVSPELVISSPANRAITTAGYFCDILGYRKERIELRMEIYEGGTSHLLNIVQNIPDSCGTAMLFGHNPSMAGLANLLAGNSIDTLDTCGVVRIDLDVPSWKDTGTGRGKLTWYEFPKKHR